MKDSNFLKIVISLVDSAEKKLEREKEEKWKIDMINKFRKIYNENGEGVYGELKEMALRYNTLVKKYFGMPKNIPPIKCEKLKDLLHGSFSSIEQHTWIILQHFQDSKPVNLLSSTVNAPSSIPSQMDTKYLSESLKNLTLEQLKQGLHIVNDNEGVHGSPEIVPLLLKRSDNIIMLFWLSDNYGILNQFQKKLFSEPI